MMYSTDELINGIKTGDKRLLSKAITLVESTNELHQKQAEEILSQAITLSGNSVRVGITGVPGAGKSTFIEHFGLFLIQKGYKVAVLAVDPSSSLSKGSILGDRTRMEYLSREENAFIRPSPSSLFLGGIARTTFETMVLLEAAGYDFLLIETVGVGQSETMVADITDMFLLLSVIGTGDELQGIKRGIMEMVDMVFINKVEDSNLNDAKNKKRELLRALHFMVEKQKGWKVPVIIGAALDDKGIDEVYDGITSFINHKKQNGNFVQTRKEQAKKRFEYWVQTLVIEKAKKSSEDLSLFQTHLENAMNLNSNPYSEARLLIENIFPEK